MSEHAVIVEFRYGQTDLSPLFSLEDDLRAAITRAACGEVDGHEIATDGSDGRLFMYGPDADKLFSVVEPILRATPFMSGASVTKRFGPSGTGTKEVSSVIETQGMDKQAASEVLKRAKELTQRGLAAQAIDALMPLSSFYDPAIRLDSLVELSTNQATLNQHQDVLTSLDGIERTLKEDLNLEKLQTSPNEQTQNFVQEMRIIRHTKAATAYEGLGRIDEAIKHARSAVRVVRERRKPGDADRVAHRE
jgi:hypothetical protein